MERGIERCRDNLHILQGQLLGLGLRAALLPRWQPVFARWDALLNEAIAAQHTLSQGELLNPFQTGNPLRRERKYLFKGRDQFVSDVLRSVYDASRPTLVLHGPRRCGKSSFLLHLPRLLPSDLLPVYYSLQAPAATSSAADFCYGLVRMLQRDLAGQGVLLPEAQRESFHANAYATLEDWLDQALPLLGTRALLLCFDEFEKLGEAVAHSRRRCLQRRSSGRSQRANPTSRTSGLNIPARHPKRSRRANNCSMLSPTLRRCPPRRAQRSAWRSGACCATM
ncbi:hypothetical protein [Candidatus Viridilinea mediisalina]|uniref:Orc1-like AAA ATPase domain-containing protein n=1 Tax=Candidatus Viridilinea mediisalina TaxID=2024553 RepID=A0A2A6RH81_9CHLR|nr:hypothetical protein [Candidatus Viridilinea mediisalina]PDW02210.1 hypothetical protein CJ255_15110 [Candidatus Viridilinea mediisalina]